MKKLKHIKERTWAYKEITEEAEQGIKRLLELSRSGGELGNTFWAMAYGIFSGWNSLTMGWQNDGDRERLEALVKVQEGNHV